MRVSLTQETTRHNGAVEHPPLPAAPLARKIFVYGSPEITVLHQFMIAKG